MAVVLVAMMAFAVQSCGSDNDDNEAYKLNVSLKIEDKGLMTTEESQTMIMSAEKMTQVANHPSDFSAEQATKTVAEGVYNLLRSSNQAFGNAVFTYTFACTKVNGGKQIVTYYVTFDKGSVGIYNNKNNIQ